MIGQFVTRLQGVLQDLQATDGAGAPLPLEEALVRALERMRASGKTLFIGNGGSAAIASHVAVDLWKNGGLEALAFNDAALLTCIGNDCGYERVFAEPIRRFAKTGDTLVAISSSGRSPNILNGVAAAREAGCGVVTLSGFTEDNPLRGQGDVNFYAPAAGYGLVEVSHLALLHSLLDAQVESRSSR